jgi:hypothetical protein
MIKPPKKVKENGGFQPKMAENCRVLGLCYCPQIEFMSA